MSAIFGQLYMIYWPTVLLNILKMMKGILQSQPMHLKLTRLDAFAPAVDFVKKIHYQRFLFPAP